MEEPETSYHHQGSNLLLFLSDQFHFLASIIESVTFDLSYKLRHHVLYKLTGCHFSFALIIYDINLLQASDELCLYRHVANFSHLAKNLQ